MPDTNIEVLSALAERVGVKEYGPMTRNWSFQPDQLIAFVELVQPPYLEKVKTALVSSLESINLLSTMPAGVARSSALGYFHGVKQQVEGALAEIIGTPETEKILTPYKYRNLPCTNATHSICGTDKYLGAGVLEWCSTKFDAQVMLERMSQYAQFENLSIHAEVDRDNSLAPEPVPPGHHARLGGHHWVQEVDFDGRLGETIVLQWAPGAKRWVHSGNLATGSYVSISGWKYVAECPMPTQDRLYVHILDNSVFVSSIDPADDNVDFETITANSFIAQMVDPRKTPLETQSGIIRNVLGNGGAKVTLV